MRYTLESRNFEVIIARDGNEGQAMIECLRPDFVILDMMMPKRSGFVVLEQLRELGVNDVPIVMISANEGTRHRQYAHFLGVVAYLCKPFAMDDLCRIIDDYFDGKERETSPPVHSSSSAQAEVSTITETALAIESIMTAAIAEITGAYCHELEKRLAVLRSTFERENAIDDMVQATISTSSCISDLHDFARQYYRDFDNHMEIVRFTALSEACGRLLELGGIDQTTVVEILVGGCADDVAIPRALLRQIIFPLIDNAVKAVHPVNGRVVLEISSTEADLVFTVTDNGQGWPPNYAVMNVAAHSLDNDAKGQGLQNLARIIQCSQGNLRLFPSKFGGAGIEVTLPRRPQLAGDFPGSLSNAIAEITGSFCHDVSNNLHVIRSECENGRYNRSLIGKCLIQAAEAIGDLHQFARAHYQNEPAGLQEIAAGQVPTYLAELTSSLSGRFELRVNCDRLNEHFTFARLLLRHLVFPLVENSVEANEACEQKVLVCVDLATLAPSLDLRISVRDNGKGFGPELLSIRKSILDSVRFSTKKQSRGRGLLNLHRLLDRMGGELRLNHASDGGAEVTIYIPQDRLGMIGSNEDRGQ